jgi:uncharacterized membrane protein
MKENVGTADAIVRSIAGPALIALGYTKLRGRRGRTAGLMAMMGGAILTQTAVTRVCPLNDALGIDTR